MLAAGMIVAGLALLLTAVIPQAWAPIGRAVRAVNTALPWGPRLTAQLLRKEEDATQHLLVQAARIVQGTLGVMLLLGAATYGATG